MTLNCVLIDHATIILAIASIISFHALEHYSNLLCVYKAHVAPHFGSRFVAYEGLSPAQFTVQKHYTGDGKYTSNFVYATTMLWYPAVKEVYVLHRITLRVSSKNFGFGGKHLSAHDQLRNLTAT